jgi:hypothetical protein
MVGYVFACAGVACEDRPHRSDSGDQHSPEIPVDNPNSVVPDSTARTMPNTGDPLYLAVGAMLLLARSWWRAVAS